MISIRSLSLSNLSSSNTSAFSSSHKRKYTAIRRRHERETAGVGVETNTSRGYHTVSLQENLEDDVDLCSNLSIGRLTPIKTHDLNSPTMEDHTTLSPKSTYDSLHRSSSDVSFRSSSCSANSRTSSSSFSYSVISPTFYSVVSDIDKNGRCCINPIDADRPYVDAPEGTTKLQPKSYSLVPVGVDSMLVSSGLSVTPLIGDFTAISMD